MSDSKPTQKLPVETIPYFYPQPDWVREHGVSHERILETRPQKITERSK